VLDPFCGSGYTLAAAQESERRFIGIEIDPVHCQTARKRLLIFLESISRETSKPVKFVVRAHAGESQLLIE
jgi:DNA modification methylase